MANCRKCDKPATHGIFTTRFNATPQETAEGYYCKEHAEDAAADYKSKVYQQSKEYQAKKREQFRQQNPAAILPRRKEKGYVPRKSWDDTTKEMEELEVGLAELSGQLDVLKAMTSRISPQLAEHNLARGEEDMHPHASDVLNQLGGKYAGKRGESTFRIKHDDPDGYVDALSSHFLKRGWRNVETGKDRAIRTVSGRSPQGQWHTYQIYSKE